MAIRVRKLAKQMKRDATELLGILHGIGISRYKSPEDMLSGVIEAKLRQAIRDGVSPVEVTLQAVRKKELPPAARSRPPQEQLLVAPVQQTTVPATPLAAPVPIPPPTPPDATRELLAALAEERLALAQLRQSLLDAQPPSAAVSLAELLQRRGLVGVDEAERAIRALAEQRRLVELLPHLVVSNPAHVEGWLKDVLLLVDGAPPEALKAEAVVSVAPDRAEIPNAAAFRRQTEQISEQLLLNGARRLVIVGGPIRLHRLINRALDPRIEVRFRPTSRVVVSDAQADLARTDAVVLWNVEVDAAAAEVYASGRAIVARVDSERLDGLFRQWMRALSG